MCSESGDTGLQGWEFLSCSQACQQRIVAPEAVVFGLSLLAGSV